MVADVVRKYKLFPAYAGVIPQPRGKEKEV